jgi:hypothetical protein
MQHAFYDFTFLFELSTVMCIPGFCQREINDNDRDTTLTQVFHLCGLFKKEKEKEKENNKNSEVITSYMVFFFFFFWSFF